MAISAPVTVHAKPRIRMLIPIWGEKYRQRWLRIPLPSLKSKNNLPYLRDHSSLEIVILTKKADREAFERDQRFARLMEGFNVKYVEIDELFPKKPAHYSVPLSLSYAHGIADLGDQAVGTYVLLLNADFVFSDGSLRTVFERIAQGYTIITGPSIRAVEEAAYPLLAQKIGDSDVLAMSGRELMSIVFDNLHSTVSSRTLNETKHVLVTHYHEFFWRISPGCLAARFLLLMPLCFQLEKPLTKAVCPVDYGFITELAPNGRFTPLEDSDDFMMLEMQHLDSEAGFIRPSPRFETEQARLEFIKKLMAANIAQWATAEQRRSATQTLVFHSGDLPDRLEEKLAPFDALADDLLQSLPPPVPHTRHFHWISALHGYRAQMLDGESYVPGSPLPYTALIQDDRNTFRVEARPNDRSATLDFKERVKSGIRTVRDALAASLLENVYNEYFQDSSTWRDRPLAVAYIGEPPRFAHLRSRAPTMTYYVAPTVANYPDPDVEITFAGLDSLPAPFSFCVCAPLESLIYWPAIQRACDKLLDAGNDVILIYFTPSQRLISFNETSWPLARVLSYFPSNRYDVTVRAHATNRFQQGYMNAISALRDYYDVLHPRFWPMLLRLALIALAGFFGQARGVVPKDANSLDQGFGALSVHLAPNAHQVAEVVTADAALNVRSAAAK